MLLVSYIQQYFNTSITVLKKKKIRFESCWLHCWKCRVLVLLRYMALTGQAFMWRCNCGIKKDSQLPPFWVSLARLQGTPSASPASHDSWRRNRGSSACVAAASAGSPDPWAGREVGGSTPGPKSSSIRHHWWLALVAGQGCPVASKKEIERSKKYKNDIKFRWKKTMTVPRNVLF